MALFATSDYCAAEAIAGIGYCNPFLPERVELERRALGSRYVPVGPVIQARPGTRVEDLFPNVPALHEAARGLVEAGARPVDDGCIGDAGRIGRLRGPRLVRPLWPLHELTGRARYPINERIWP